MKAQVMIFAMVLLACCAFGDDEALRRAQGSPRILGIPNDLRARESRVKPSYFRFEDKRLTVMLDTNRRFHSLYDGLAMEQSRQTRAVRRPWGDRRAFDEHVRSLFHLLGISMDGYVIEKYTEVAEDDPNFEEKGVVEIKYESIVYGYRGCGMRLMSLDRETARPFRVWVGAEWEYGPARINITAEEAARIARARMVEENPDRELPSESEIAAAFDLRYVPENVHRADPEKDMRARLAYDLVRGNSDLVWVDAENGRILNHSRMLSMAHGNGAGGRERPSRPAPAETTSETNAPTAGPPSSSSGTLIVGLVVVCGSAVVVAGFAALRGR